MTTTTPSQAFSPSRSSSRSRRAQTPTLLTSLTPLEPRYPVFPSDYDSYYDPSTTRLHTSHSLSQLAHRPVSDREGILSPVPSPSISRDPSRSRRRKLRSHVRIDAPIGVDEVETESVMRQRARTAGNTRTNSPDIARRQLKARSHIDLPLLKNPTAPGRNIEADADWLEHTALSLVSTTAEERGQTWLSLSKRTSASDLTSYHLSNYYPSQDTPNPEAVKRALAHAERIRSRPASRLNSRTQSRVGSEAPTRQQSRLPSRNVSRNTSRRDLRMTGLSSASFTTALSSKPTDASHNDEDTLHEDTDGEVEPHWSDPSTLAELAADKLARGQVDISSDDQENEASNTLDRLDDELTHAHSISTYRSIPGSRNSSTRDLWESSDPGHPGDRYGRLDFSVLYEDPNQHDGNTSNETDTKAQWDRTLALEEDMRDEREVARAMKWWGVGRRIGGVGRVFGSAVDALIDLEEEEELDEQDQESHESQEKTPRRESVTGSFRVDTPPDETAGLWEDMRWFGKLIIGSS